MTSTQNLQEDIQQQINIGFSKEEISQNLVSKGFDATEVKQALDKIDFSAAAAESNGGTVSTKSILLGVLFVLVAIFRFARFSGGGSGLLFIGVLTAVGMAIYFFTKKS